ncbi:hypothetical protein R9C00_13240 [Flammeovirgaceae bacterium SG7u.111]|nr:hypothetical protein [Flammeovirgaceae bacterium SG7u.132]WPO38421.1 hypothetical protein R9C00_13240 [Flammeovirgaceae bacterium SG7u.111]
MNILKRLNLLEQIERELAKTLKDDKKNWVKTARLLYKIENENLYELKAKSYTQYVKQLATINHINVSTLWRAKTAAGTYMELSNLKDVDLLDETLIKTTPEQLETFKKVRTIAPTQITSALKEKLLKGEKIRNELHDIWETYKPLKKGKTERGRKNSAKPEPVFAEPGYFGLGGEDTVSDAEKMSKYFISEDELTSANIKNSLRDKSWVQRTLGKYYLPCFATFTDLVIRDEEDNSINKIDIVAISKTSNTKTGKPVTLGVSILSELGSNLESKLRWAKYFHYFYIAVPLGTSNIDISGQNNFGLLTISPETKKEGLTHHIQILSPARALEVSDSALSMTYSQILQRSLRW